MTVRTFGCKRLSLFTCVFWVALILTVSLNQVAVAQQTSAPPVKSADIASNPTPDEFRQRGLTGPDQAAQVGITLATFVKIASVARGFQDGLEFLSLVMLGLGLPLTLLRFLSPPQQHMIPDPHAWNA